MGIYQNDLVVPHVPFVLPKLCVIVYATTPWDRPFKNATVRIQTDNEILAELQVASEAVEASQNTIIANSDGSKKEDKRLMLAAVISISQLIIKESSIIRVRVITESEELKGHGLAIKVAAPVIRQEPTP